MTAPAAGGGDTRDGQDCRICGGIDGKHDGASHDAYVADRPAWTFPARPAAAPADDTGELRETIRDLLIDRYGEQPVRDRDAWLPDADAVLALPAVRALIDGARTDRADDVDEEAANVLYGDVDYGAFMPYADAQALRQRIADALRTDRARITAVEALADWLSRADWRDGVTAHLATKITLRRLRRVLGGER